MGEAVEHALATMPRRRSCCEMGLVMHLWDGCAEYTDFTRS